MAQDIGPLDWRIPIVTEDGKPTSEFQRRWATQISNNSRIGLITTGSGAPPVSPAPSDGEPYIDISTNPYTLYVGSGGTWHAITDINALLDSISSTHGSVLFRGSTDWQSLPPGTSGQFLKTNGAGADPTWATSSGSQETELSMPSNLDPKGATGNVGGGLADNFFFGRAILCPRTTTINSIKFYATAAQTLSKVTPAVYSDSTTSMGAISGSGSQVTGVTQGLNKFPLTAGVSVTKGQLVWIGFHYLVNGGGTLTIASDSGGSDACFYAGALQNPGPPAGVTYSTTRGWAAFWASSDT